jgi:hypothetical protein
MQARTQAPNHNLDQQGGGELDLTKYKEFQIKLSSGEIFYLLALNSMQAAFNALELSKDRNSKLLDVKLTDEW